MATVTENIDHHMIRQAWLDTKQSYVTNKNAINRDELLTYRKMKYRRDNLLNYMRKREGRSGLSCSEKFQGFDFIPDGELDIEWINQSRVDLKSSVSCQSHLYDIEKEMSKAYREELEMVIQFQLLLVLEAEILKEAKKKYLFKFINEKKATLYTLGININIPDIGTMPVRYARVIT